MSIEIAELAIRIIFGWIVVLYLAKKFEKL